MVCGQQRMKHSDFGDPLTFPLAPPAGSYLALLVKCFDKRWMDSHTTWYILYIHGSKMMNPDVFGHSLTFLPVPPAG